MKKIVASLWLVLTGLGAVAQAIQYTLPATLPLGSLANVDAWAQQQVRGIAVNCWDESLNPVYDDEATFRFEPSHDTYASYLPGLLSLRLSAALTNTNPDQQFYANVAAYGPNLTMLYYYRTPFRLVKGTSGAWILPSSITNEWPWKLYAAGRSGAIEMMIPGLVRAELAVDGSGTNAFRGDVPPISGLSYPGEWGLWRTYSWSELVLNAPLVAQGYTGSATLHLVDGQTGTYDLQTGLPIPRPSLKQSIALKAGEPVLQITGAPGAVIVLTCSTNADGASVSTVATHLLTLGADGTVSWTNDLDLPGVFFKTAYRDP